MQLSSRDRASLGLVGQGSEQAFLALVDRYQPNLLRVAELWLDDPSEAEAVVLQTWHDMLHHMDSFDARASLKGWLCAVLIAIARKRANALDDDPALWVAQGVAEPAVDPARFSPPGDRWEGHWQKPPVDWPGMREPAVLTAPLQQTLEAAIAALPKHQRIVLVLRDVEGLTGDEVERALGLAAEAQRVLLHRARSAVRARLERDHDEGTGAA